MRKVIAYFIRYHVAVNIFIIAFFAFGIIGLLSLKSSFFPLTDSKIININIAYPGASPQEIEEGIVLKIEDNLKGLKGVDRVTSVSRENSGIITVEIQKGENIDFMLLEVKNAVDRVPSFPTGMEPLIVAKREEVRQTISFAVNGKDVPLATLKQIARQIENDLRTIDGISQVELSGYPVEEIEIAVNETSLLAYNLTFDDVSQAVSASNILVTGGNIKTDAEEYLIRANNRNYYGDELSNIIVKASNDGKIVRLKDVAIIRDRFAETPNAAYFNQQLSVNITITSTNSEDLISSADQVKQYIEAYNQKYNNVRLDVVRDLSITLNQRTELLTKNAIAGMLLVLLFLSLFLNTRVAFWVAFGLPISFLGMFIFAGQFDVTINVLSLFGMIIVVGILVDDGIVVGENIYQHYEKGKSPIQAAIDGTMEVIPPVVSAIITTLLAFSLFLFLDSRIGEFFGEVSIIVILTLSVSLIEALIILPAHLAHSKALHKMEVEKHPSKIKQFFSKMREVNKLGDRFMRYLRDNMYTPTLEFVLKFKMLALSIFIVLLILTFGSIGGGIIGVTLFPSIASDTVSIELDMPNGTNVKVTDSIISMIEEKSFIVNKEFTEKYLKGTDKVLFENTILSLNSSSSARLEINLLPGEERPDAINTSLVANRLRELVGPVIGVERLIFGSGGNFGGSPVSVSLLSNNISELKAAKFELKTFLESNPLLKDIEDNDPAGIKEIRLELKENAYLLGLDLRTVMSQVRAGFFGVQAQRFQRGQDEIRVWVRYDRSNRESINDLDNMRIVTPTGERVNFKDIATYTIERGDVAINHLEGQREIQVSADLKDPSNSATDILDDIRTMFIPELQSKYPTISASFEGQNREATKLSRSLKSAGGIILLLIYITIAFTFRSYSQPLFLILLVPFSLTAVAWGHWLLGFPVNVISLLGIIALIGIMVNDGLVLIGKFNSNLKEGMKFEEALLNAGKSRFRAIFLTSLTTIAGLAPLLLEKSRQAQFLKPMAISISFGIFYATILTLLLLPVLLSFSNSIKQNVKWLATGNKVTKEEVERAIKEQIEEHEK
ncbi:MAG: efflux RND transporter permease subunit [Flavobacteriales bacterium]|nr:efflux RND transporter permease subunit [Flavobacteriia bacterium]NCP05966.1 efflux RND transporter permease subunit [Flavobacteriales bacterium]PIV94415.1 MAG: RND transporter [Flavobacteriaceae bacterium CG17_big_fil_post_rev_8_21_14_2_50_33_15]PIY10023.1 MAG: RND transporter [Flavobacteriaceae bacterium CG_4_10_14_3_um_filter_33_47]PJB17596.1 MAG: RND transporter [Flavobacteriaceae bacterium CG_4_9_14_3_um_filter_33_16]